MARDGRTLWLMLAMIGTLGAGPALANDGTPGQGAGPFLAQLDDRGDRVDERLDRRGEAMNERLDQRG
ncbi:MAG: hypothetical protein ACREI3_11645, partial [Nitrospirales bacterium]